MSIVYSAQCETAQTKSRPVTLLPLLVVLFIVSYGILTMLVVEQGRTIESQRNLIHLMLQDSTQLASLKGKLARDEGKRLHDKTPAPAEHKSQAEHKDADSGNPEVGPREAERETQRPGKSARSMKEVPGKPAADLADVRRSTRVI